MTKNGITKQYETLPCRTRPSNDAFQCMLLVRLGLSRLGRTPAAPHHICTGGRFRRRRWNLSRDNAGTFALEIDTETLDLRCATSSWPIDWVIGRVTCCKLWLHELLAPADRCECSWPLLSSTFDELLSISSLRIVAALNSVRGMPLHPTCQCQTARGTTRRPLCGTRVV